MRRRGIGILMLTVIGLAAGLGYLEWTRPRVDLATPVPSLAEPAQPRDAPDLADPEAFTAFIERLRARYRAMHARYLTLRHRELIDEEEIDPSEKVVASHRIEEMVWFEDGQERRRRISRRDSLTGSVDPPSLAPIVPANPPVGKLLYPFYKEDQPGFYRYGFEGLEEVDGETLARVRFDPNDPVDRKLSGYVWADPVTGQPRRFDGLMARPPAFIDAFRMIARYDRSENGEYQLRRMTTEGTGGFAFIRKRYRKDFRFQDYEQPQGTEAENR